MTSPTVGYRVASVENQTKQGVEYEDALFQSVTARLGVKIATFAIVLLSSGCSTPRETSMPSQPSVQEASRQTPSASSSIETGSTESVLSKYDSSHQLTASEAEQAYRESLDDAAAAGSIQNPPSVPRIRFISPEELGSVRVDCLRDQGIPAKATEGLGYSLGDVPASQGAAANLADYVCQAKFPLHPQYNLPASSAAKGLAYDWMVNQTIPCLKAQGLLIDSPPSREVWVASGANAWLPDDDLLQQLKDRSAVQRALAACPQPRVSDMMEHPPGDG